MPNQLFRRKSVERILRESEREKMETEHGGSLRRTLRVGDLTAFGIAAIIGAGIFGTVGQAAHDGGPAVSLLFVFIAIACGFTAFCYAEFASMIPVSGSAYTYAYASFGELIAWIIGWDLVLEYAFSAATVASGWSANLVSLLADFSVHLPAEFTDTPMNHGIFNVPAFLIVCVVTAILVLGVRESANVNVIVV